MLLRSASSPILYSWLSPSPETTSLVEIPIPRTRSVSSWPSFSSSRRTLTRALSEPDLSPSLAPKPAPTIEEEAEIPPPFLDYVLTSSGLMDGTSFVVDAGCSMSTTGEGCGGGGSEGRGKLCGGRGGDPENNQSAAATEAYYRRMIEASPGNSLLLGNYAKFLKEVRGDMVRAGEYCERAILASPGDAGVLALYADIIWQESGDAERAEAYFDKAVQAAPDDCYVMASYARFLWDAEEEEEEGEEHDGTWSSSPLYPVAAAS